MSREVSMLTCLPDQVELDDVVGRAAAPELRDGQAVLDFVASDARVEVEDDVGEVFGGVAERRNLVAVEAVEDGETARVEDVVLEVVHERAVPGVGPWASRTSTGSRMRFEVSGSALTSLPALSSGASPEMWRTVGSPVLAGVFSMLYWTASAVRSSESHRVPRVAVSS